MALYKEGYDCDYKIIVQNYMATWYTDETPVPDGKMRVRFFYKKVLHRTDGPAVVTWDIHKKGITRLFYIHGKQCEPEMYINVLNAPLKDFPLYLNHYPYSEIAKDRLSGSRTEIELKESSNLEPDIQKRIWTHSPKQILIKNLADIINAATFRCIQNIKPFKVLS